MVLGNGNTLVCLDNFGQIRDFYFPYVGHENHIGRGQLHKIGVWVDGVVHWVDNGHWKITIDYTDDSMISRMEAVNYKIKIAIESSDIMYNEKNIFLRKFLVTNLDQRKRNIKVYLNQQFKISDTDHADTAYFSSIIESIIHYKGRRVFLTGGVCDGVSFDDYSIGFCGIEGKEGTWKDAEDGLLSQNSIEHGIVDSVIGWSRDVGEKQSMTVHYWIAVGETYREVAGLLSYIKEKTPDHLIESTKNFWRAWSHQFTSDIGYLSPKIQKVFLNSLLVMKAHTDQNGGILASADSGNIQYGGDTYGYVWPRDACYTAWSFDLAQYHDVSKNFYTFASQILTDDGYVLHKYQPDKSLGSSWHPWFKNGNERIPIQEDETAILLVGLWEHYIRHKDLEFIESLYNDFIKKIARFLIGYKDLSTNLPLPSYDLWEERYCVSVYTTSLVYGALVAASNFAKTLGKEDDAQEFFREANHFRKAIITHLWNEEKSSFLSLVENNGVLEREDRLDASNFYGLFRFGILSPDDPRMIKCFDVISTKLAVAGDSTFIARYEEDNYNRVSKDITGNPWFITSLWFIQYRISKAMTLGEIAEVYSALEKLSLKIKYSMMPEQINFYTSEYISATPLVWSHAEFVRTVIEYEKRYKILKSKSDESKN
jgi:GH15 family glucan-1,4-alpha-glucosidase